MIDERRSATAMTRRSELAERIAALSRDATGLEPAVGTLLGRLATAIRDGHGHEAAGYVAAIEPRALAELLSDTRSRVWGLLEVLRNVLVFAPIAVTWYGLSAAATAYGNLLAARPDLVSRPFLLLWQEGFAGAAVLNFSTLALVDATLIGILIGLSLALFLRQELRDASSRTRLLLKESEIRALLGEASSFGSLGDVDPETLVAEMAAEERRIYERAMEREARLFDLEAALDKLNEAAARLERAADAMARR